MYSLVPHVVAAARASDGACVARHSTTFTPLARLHRLLQVHGSGTASLVRTCQMRVRVRQGWGRVGFDLP